VRRDGHPLRAVLMLLQYFTLVKVTRQSGDNSGALALTWQGHIRRNVPSQRTTQPYLAVQRCADSTMMKEILPGSSPMPLLDTTECTVPCVATRVKTQILPCTISQWQPA
jgi:hypothetical protein